MTRFPIIALVGHSGSGKTTLMERILERLPDHVFRIKYLTSRAKRDASDDLSYYFLTPGEFARMETAGELASHTEYSGYHYGTSHANLAMLREKFGMQAYTQQSIENIRKAGYEVIAVKIESHALDDRGDGKRKQDDLERDKKDVGYSLVIRNSFAPGGLEKAADELTSFILSLRNQLSNAGNPEARG